MTSGRWIAAGLVAGFAFWVSLHLFFSDDSYVLEHFAPRTPALLLYCVAAFMALRIKDLLLRMLGVIWVIWPVIGTYFSLGHYFQRHLWAPLDFNEPNNIFLYGTICMLAGIHLFLLVSPLSKVPAPPASLRVINAVPLFIFPFIYTAVLLNTGNNLLSGEAIQDQMYSSDRGPIYGFRIALVMAVAWLGIYSQCVVRLKKCMVVLLIVSILLVAVLDGKRDMALLCILVLASVALLRSPKPQGNLFPFLSLALALLFYGFIGNLRSDRTFVDEPWIAFATLAGVEYRDFAHSINYWSASYISTFQYDFLRSSLGALVNSETLSVFNLSKADLVEMDSARAWQKAFQSNSGIRTGLLSELYFGFPTAWPLLLFGFGFICGIMRKWVNNAQSDLTQVTSLTFYAAFTLAVFSQSTATLGYVMTILYIILLLIIWRKIATSTLNVLNGTI